MLDDVDISVENSLEPLLDANEWNVIETEFNPTQLHHKETVFTLSNGYLGTRGSFEVTKPQKIYGTNYHW